MSAVNVRAGLIERLQTITGLRVLSAEPLTLHNAPAAIVSLSGGTLNSAGQVKSRTWRFAVRVCVAFQDNVIAEDQLVPYADSVTDAVLDDLTLGGRANVVPSIEIGSEGPDGYYQIGEVTFRSVVFRFDVRDKLGG
jgi:hypothetical protein